MGNLPEAGEPTAGPRRARAGAIRAVPLWRWAAVGAAALLLWRLRPLWTPFILALVLAYLLEPLVGLLERRDVPRGPAILVIYLAVGLLVSLAWLYVAPALYHEAEALAQRLPEVTQGLQDQAERLLWRVRPDALPEAARAAVDGAVARLEAFAARLATRMADLLVGLVSQVFNLILAPVLAYYILKDRERLARGLLQALPHAWRPAALRLAVEVDQTLAAFIRGQLVVSMVVGALVAAGLAVLKVRYALLLGLLTGVLDIIPYFGPIAAAVPIVGLSLLSSPWTALWAVALLVGANQLEGMVLQPKVMSRSTGLHPLVVIAAVLAGAELGGVLGMLAAVPVAATVRTVWRALSSPEGPDPTPSAASAPESAAALAASPPEGVAPPGAGEVVGKGSPPSR